MLVASDPTVLPQLVEIINPEPQGFLVLCLCCASEHNIPQVTSVRQHIFHLTCRQAGWVECLSPYQLRIKYKPGKELITADALSQLYIAFITGDDGLDPDWPILYLCPEATCYKGLNSVTISKLKYNESQFSPMLAMSATGRDR
ncbi:hypothetical protein DSO57_1026967 [Entomophthora muscae]|uniref:Uncharacterized protein n=1 Tax=Entomophthora muscae TaxID=34485 RepID=A0ACC2UBD9_9FUNG|nr:hypothetical protein DSO57_1026967 [Entomophthora muscae]